MLHSQIVIKFIHTQTHTLSDGSRIQIYRLEKSVKGRDFKNLVVLVFIHDEIHDTTYAAIKPIQSFDSAN